MGGAPTGNIIGAYKSIVANHCLEIFKHKYPGKKGPVRRHGNPSHGIGLTPDEKELWLCDGHNMRLHVFSAIPPYQQLTTIALQDMPGWVTFSLDGQYAYPSSGEVIDVKTRRVLTTLKDEFNNSVASEKMLELQFNGKKLTGAGDQFGIGRKRK